MFHRVVVGAIVWLTVSVSLTSAADDQREQYFVENVLPLLKKHCFECHSHQSETAEGGLVLDSRTGWQVGGDSGRAIVPKQPDKSLLLSALSYANEDIKMPPDGKLTAREIGVFRQWITDGAFDPRTEPSGKPKVGNRPAANELWSLRPVKSLIPPQIHDSWIRNDIDRFVLAKLHSVKLKPNKAANQFTLLRRATFDLTGMPPSIENTNHFVNDGRERAWELLIDRLLQSPRYGERWGRHWLDLARYSDSNGGDINYAHANAWRYRDYVIRAFNADKPYDEFIVEQIAGDLLRDTRETRSNPRGKELSNKQQPSADTASERHHSKEQQDRDPLTATGFLMLGPKMLAEVDTDKLLIDIADEQLDVVGQTFLGMTFGCARCHDHKFDPITTEDYYAMAGIFRSTKVIDVLRPSNGVSEWLEIDVTPKTTRAQIDQLNQQRRQLQKRLADLGVPATKQPTGNSASQAVVVQNLPLLKSTSWCAWVRIDKSQNLGAVVSAQYDGAGQGHSLGFDRGRLPRVVWNHGSNAHTIIAATRPVTAGRWHHLVVTFDAPSKRLAMFVDGMLAVSAESVQSTSFSAISVGRRESSMQWQLNGDVDEVLVFASVLSQEQIKSLAERKTISTKPVLHWSFDQIRDDKVLDSGGKHHGRLIGLAEKTHIIKTGAVGHALSVRPPTTKTPSATSVPSASVTAEIAKLRQQLQHIEATSPVPTNVMAVAAGTPVDLPIHIRGSHTNLGDTAIRRSTPKVFRTALPAAAIPPSDNGRLQLAHWIASPSNPLTARVMVNRIWQHHFGHGLVRSSSNFGWRGTQPSHPQLLDWLANEFVRSGWSIKYLHRLIMNSATYRMSSRRHAKAEQSDPENRWFARFKIRRLEAEAIRDSLLAVTGELKLQPPGSLFKSPNKQRVKMTPTDPVYDSFHRSVYLPSVRVRSYEMFSIFDVSDNGQHVAIRPQTLVAQQALFLMNNPFVVNRSTALAKQVATQDRSVPDRIDWLYRRLYCRPATGVETETLAASFVKLAEFDRVGHKTTADKSDVSAWQHLIHTMMCANEFIHVR